MNLTQVKQAIQEAPKGANIVLEWSRPVKVLKRFKDVPLVKDVRMVGRVGIDYDHIQAVQQKRESGELPKENAGLPSWQEWEIFPFLLKHKANGTKYLRLYNGTSDKIRPAVQFRIGNTVVDQEQIEHMLPASEKQTKKGDCFVVKVPNIRRVHVEQAPNNEVAETPQEIDEMGIRFVEEEEMATIEQAFQQLDNGMQLLQQLHDE